MPKNETIKLMKDGVEKSYTKQPDRNNEHLFVAEDGSFVKFPADADLDELIAKHNEANSAHVEVIDEDEHGNVLGSRIPAREV